MKNKLMMISIFFILSTAMIQNAFADIYLAAYTPQTSQGLYQNKINSIQITQAYDASGTRLEGKHSIFVKTSHPTKGNLILGFKGDDIQSGLAFLNMIGKTVQITIDRDPNNQLMVKKIEINS